MPPASEPSAPGLVLGWPWSFRLAPNQLTQPINPGWTFGNVTINSANSSAPEVEQEVVAKHSYGRQIGRMMDALHVLVTQLPAAAAAEHKAQIEPFLTLAAEIAAIKKSGKAERLARLQAELEALKKEDRAAWDRLVGRR